MQSDKNLNKIAYLLAFLAISKFYSRWVVPTCSEREARMDDPMIQLP